VFVDVEIGEGGRCIFRRSLGETAYFDGLPSLRAPLFFFIPRNISPALISARIRMSVACSISSRSLAWCA
jgi:hypothetical protein